MTSASAVFGVFELAVGSGDGVSFLQEWTELSMFRGLSPCTNGFFQVISDPHLLHWLNLWAAPFWLGHCDNYNIFHFLILIITMVGATKYIPIFNKIKLIPYPKTSTSESISTWFKIERLEIIGVIAFLVLRKEDYNLAKDCFIWGIVINTVALVAYTIVSTSIWLSV